MTRYTSPAPWRPLSLLVCHALAAVLMLSWLYAPTRALWDGLDAAVFYRFNGSLADGAGWQYLWAMLNSRNFDVVSGIIILGLLAWWVLSGGRTRIAERASVGLLMGFAVAIIMRLAKSFMEIDRDGPSLVLEPAILLGDIVTDFHFKDRSGNSFPGDHGITLIIITTLFWFYAGRRYGLIMTALSALLLTPRLMVGAHWITDIMIGGSFICLLGLAWLLASPLHGRYHAFAVPLIEKLLCFGERLIGRLVQDPAAATQAIAATPLHMLKGVCMGTADVIPGVSGGTMALILGIYERLLGAIRSFDKAWLGSLLRLRISEALGRNDLLFLVPLLLGIVMALAIFTKVIPLPVLIVTQPELVYGLFFGLIVASILILMGEVERYGVSQVLVTLVGIAFGLAIVTQVPVETPTALWFIFLCGFVAISAMLLPGISGSFILLLMGKYAYIINALGEVNIPVILAFAGGALVGLIVFSRAIVWMLRHYHQQTLLVIKGILIGSLWMIWPFQERIYETVREKQKLVSTTPVLPEALDGTFFGSLALMVGGFVLVMLIHRMAQRRQQG